MYLKILFALTIGLFGVARGSSDSGLSDLLQQHSATSFAFRHAIIAQPPSPIARNSHLLGGHLEVRGGVCPSGYSPCGGDSCCPPGCIPCNDNTKTCCEIGLCSILLLCSPTGSYLPSGTFCTTNHSKPVCGCFGGCPNQPKPPPPKPPPSTSSTHHTTSKPTFGVSVTGTATFTTPTSSSVEFNSTTTPNSLSTPTY